MSNMKCENCGKPVVIKKVYCGEPCEAPPTLTRQEKDGFWITICKWVCGWKE